VKDIETLADLKGRRVGVNDGSVSDFYLNVLLAKTGLQESDLETVNPAAAPHDGRLDQRAVDDPQTPDHALDPRGGGPWFCLDAVGQSR